MISHVGRSHQLIRSSMFVLLLMTPWVTGCVEAGLQSGVFACNMDSECPPGGFFCDNYFNTYMYYKDVTARPTVHGYWGFCNSDSEVIPKVTSPQKVYAETCDNNRDDDEDGYTDCNDTECQTAPVCKNQIRRECIEGIGDELECDSRVGFPFIRPGDRQDACPLAVGLDSEVSTSAAYFSGTTMDRACLPRCRLYFDYFRNDMELNDDTDFAGSDAYCTEVVKNLGTAGDSFGSEMKCVHVDLKDNQAKVPAQIDVCVPKRTGDDCAVDCPGQPCLKLHTRERNYLALNQATGKLVPIDTSIPLSQIDDQVIEFCLTPLFD